MCCRPGPRCLMTTSSAPAIAASCSTPVRRTGNKTPNSAGFGRYPRRSRRSRLVTGLDRRYDESAEQTPAIELGRQEHRARPPALVEGCRFLRQVLARFPSPGSAVLLQARLSAPGQAAASSRKMSRSSAPRRARRHRLGSSSVWPPCRQEEDWSDMAWRADTCSSIGPQKEFSPRQKLCTCHWPPHLPWVPVTRRSSLCPKGPNPLGAS